MSARWLVCLTAGTLLGLVAGPVLAAEQGRKEFPLKYRLSVNVTQEVGYGGQYLQPTTQKPKLGEEPKYQSREPLYATVRLGAKHEPFTVVLDNSGGENRHYDILYVDVDRNGCITPAEKFTGMPYNNATVFGPVKLLINCGKEKCPQWFLFQLYEFEGQRPDGNSQVFRNLQVINAGYYQGVVTFGDQKRLVAFVDADGNGLYNDLMKEDGRGGDRLLIDVNGDGKLDGSYQSEESQPLGCYIQVGDRYWQVEVSPDGSSVAVAPLNKPLGTIRAAQTDYTLLLRGEEGVIRIRSKDGTARVPAGDYRLVQCAYQATDSSGRQWHFAASNHGGSGRVIHVPPDGDVQAAFGPVLVPKVIASPAGGGQLTLNLALRGAGGETYNDVHIGNYERPPVPKARILDANDRELAVLDFHYG